MVVVNESRVDKVRSVADIRAIVKPIAKKHHVQEMYLFGSHARGEADKDSDLDFAVKVKGTDLEGIGFFGFKKELEDIFVGKIDLIELDSVPFDLLKVKGIKVNDRLWSRANFVQAFEKDKVSIL
jgi:predicted nucleotidyltransferase